MLLDGQKAVGVEYVEEIGLGETKQVYARQLALLDNGLGTIRDPLTAPEVLVPPPEPFQSSSAMRP